MESPVRGREGLEIRSFGIVFRLERRLHRIDRWRLPLPYGLPVRGLAYGAAAAVLFAVLGRFPLLGELVGLIPPPARFLLLPFGIGLALARARVDGRPAHGFALGWLAFRFGPRRLNAFRPVPVAGAVEAVAEEITFIPDERGPRYRRARVRGSGRLLLRMPGRAEAFGARLLVRQTGATALRRGKELVLRPGQEVRFR